MTFEERLASRAREIEDRLERVLVPRGPAGETVPARLAAAMRHAAMTGGKRIRPYLVLESAAVFAAEAPTAMPAALAVELVHCYSLVHDDLPAMDNDELRRGQPSVWKAFDEWTAILAGDALLTLAFEQLAGPELPLADDLKATLVTALARAAGAAGMVGGQALDLSADKLGEPRRPGAAHIRELQAMKTGALFRFACEAGAVVARAQPGDRAALASFGERLGAAFQLADDLLDVEGEAATVGKATGKDMAAGKATLVALLGVEGGHARLREIEAEALVELRRFGAAADKLRAALQFAVTRSR